MANVLVEETSLSNIASAIREKNGGSATYKPSEMATAISNLPTGGSSDGEDNIITRNISGDYVNDRVSSIGDGAFFNSNVSSISMSNVTSIGDSSICRCRNLVSVDLPALTTIRTYKDMNNVITNCRYSINNNPNLLTINCPSLTNVGMSSGLFATNPKLVTLNWSPTDGTLADTFSGDSSLTHINLSQFHGTISGQMFAWCSNLQSISFSNGFSFGGNTQYMFVDCSSLTSLNLSNGGEVTADSTTFQNNSSLTWLKANYTRLSGYTFSGFSALKALILPQTDSTKMCVLASPSTQVFSNCNIGTTTSDGYIYVPRTLLESYKTATNWVVMAKYIRAIEDYPDITGG